MKNILFYIPAILYIFLSAQAMEDNKKSDSITLNVLNTHYTHETEFTGTFTYADTTQKNISLILSAFVDELPPPEERTYIPCGEIKNIEVLLTNHPEESDSQGRENTLIADLEFNPGSSVIKEIIFTIDVRKISYTLLGNQ